MNLVLARLPQGVRNLCAVQRAHQLSAGESFLHSKHLLIGDKTVQYRLDTHAENLQKHARHPEGQQKAQEHWRDDTANAVVVQGVNDGQIAHKCGTGRNKHLWETNKVSNFYTLIEQMSSFASKDSTSTELCSLH